MATHHPCRGMTRAQRRDFELIATGRRPLGGYLTLKKLKERGLIEDGPPEVLGRDALGKITRPTWTVPLAVHMQWCQHCSEQVAPREPGVIRPKKPDRTRSCERKIKYASEPPANERVRPYKCGFCDGWHMTSRPEAMHKTAKSIKTGD